MQGVNVMPVLEIIINKAHALAGIKSELTPFDAEDLTKMILSKFNTLSPEEIQKAFELERYGDYQTRTEHFQLFNASYVSEILIKFQNWKMQKKKELQIKLPEPEEPQITEAEKNEILFGAVENAFDCWIENKSFDHSVFYIHDFLCRIGIIKSNSDKYKSLLEDCTTDALLEIEEEKQKELHSANSIYERRSVKKTLERKILYNSGLVKNRAKELLLAKVFEKYQSQKDEFLQRVKNAI